MQSFVRVAGLGLFGYIFPRLLIALGTPLDVWINELASLLMGVPTMIAQDITMMSLGLFVALSLMFVELWWKPLGRSIAWVRNWKSGVIAEPSPHITLINLMREAEKQGWRFSDDGSQHIFTFVRGLRDAGSTGAIQMYGRSKQRINSTTRDMALAEIKKEYWHEFLIDAISCLQISRTKGEAECIASDNLQTSTKDDANDIQHGLYADIHLDRKQAIQWLANNSADHLTE